MDSVTKIKKICELTASISEEEFEQLKEMAQEQLDYINPLKQATQAKYHSLGKHNQKIVACLEELKRVYQEGKNLS